MGGSSTACKANSALCMEYHVCTSIISVWYEGGVTEDQNLYHCDPWVKTKIST